MLGIGMRFQHASLVREDAVEEALAAPQVQDLLESRELSEHVLREAPQDIAVRLVGLADEQARRLVQRPPCPRGSPYEGLQRGREVLRPRAQLERPAPAPEEREPAVVARGRPPDLGESTNEPAMQSAVHGETSEGRG